MAISAIESGYKVALLCKISTHQDLIESFGIKVINWSLNRKSINFISEIKAYREVFATINSYQPDLVHSVALKPMLYNALQLYSKFNYSRVYALGGLGYIFSSKKMKAKILRYLLVAILKLAFKFRNARIILQNPDDVKLLLSLKIIESSRISLIKGVGVDTEIFKPSKKKPEIQTVILPARILWDKGISDFIQVAKAIKTDLPDVRFALVGAPDNHNPESVPIAKINKWVELGIIEWWGHKNEMHKIYNLASIVCFPSYHEGFPKSLLEAASCGIPIVAYDVPGSREIVINEKNGLLVPLKSVIKLTNAIKTLLHDSYLSNNYGLSGRELVLSEFSQEKIASETKALWEEVLN